MQIADFYNQPGIYESILSELKKKGIEPGKTRTTDISPADEFHIRGAESTRELAKEALRKPGEKILDAGCGIGGTCRLLASEFGCIATGLDITPEYIRTAQKLSALTGMDKSTRFIEGSVLNMPFESASFDVVWTQHVQMNIEEKAKFYREVNRVLMPGGRFVYYDIFSTGEMEIHYPVPWAGNPELNFLVNTQRLQDLLANEGLELVSTRNQTASALKSLERSFQNWLPFKEKLPGGHLLMGSNYRQKMENLLKNLKEGRIELQSGMAIKNLQKKTHKD